MDSLLLISRRITGMPSMLAVVCDGVGSLTDGAFASVESVRLLSEWFFGVAETQLTGLYLHDEVLSINASIIASANGKGVNTATTLSALLLVGRQYYIAHAGDSRIYSIDDAGLRPLTIDAVTQSGRLMSYVGRRDDPGLYCAEGIADSGAFLLCSDGLFKRVGDEELFMNIDIGSRKALQKSLNELSNFAIQRGECDNISVALVKTI